MKNNINAESFIRLFKALPIETKSRKKINKALLNQTLSRGFLFDPSVEDNYSEKDLKTFAHTADKLFGKSFESLNSSFHKSWKKVKTASNEQLFMEQITHYLTTYGFEELGIYDESSIYIPNEVLELPEKGETKINVVVIKGLTKKELKSKLLDLLSSGIALSEKTLEDVTTVANYVGINEADIESIKNKEAKIILSDKLDIVPQDPVEFLRFAIYKTTKKTLIIKSNEAIEEIKNSSVGLITNFKNYEKKVGLEKLASIFYRFKPLFLAFRSNKKMRPYINRIRRMADKNHVPVHGDYLNTFTEKLNNREKIDYIKFNASLSKANIFRKIRLAYALKFRLSESDAILYKVRNGKGYATDFKFKKNPITRVALDMTLDSIAEDMKKNVKGKRIFIPEFINYALPATEKQFTGYFPSGTCVSVPKNMIFGVHWEDTERGRIDLDLSLMNQNEKFGWDSYYRNERGTLLFSGDMTAAPKPRGASELYYLRGVASRDGNYMVYVNYYNYDQENPVPFNIVVGSEEVTRLANNHTINPDNIVAMASTEINKKQKLLGLVKVSKKGNKFYFCETNIGKDITSYNNEFTKKTLEYLNDFYSNTIDMKDVLERAGARIVKNPKLCDIDLSPNLLDKTTILDLLK